MVQPLLYRVGPADAGRGLIHTPAQWAQRLGVSQPTMARIERGDPAVAMASYVMCMWLVNQAQGLAALIAPQNDHASLELEVARVQSRQPSGVGISTKKVAAKHAGPNQRNASQNSTAAGLAALLSGGKIPRP